MKKILGLVFIFIQFSLYAQQRGKEFFIPRHKIPEIRQTTASKHVSRSPNTVYMALDSILTVYQDALFKDFFTYDSLGNVLRYDYYEYDSGVFSSADRTEFTYDAEGKITEMISSYYDAYYNIWQYNYKETHFYATSTGYLDSTAYYDYNSNGPSWELEAYTLYTYDNRGNLVEETDFDYNSSSGISEYDIRHLYSYDSLNRQTEIIAQDYDNGNWINSERTTFSYNSNGLREESISYEYDNGAWQPLWKDVVAYTPSANPENIYYYTYDSLNGWEYSGRILFSYDSLDNLIRLTYQNYISQSWVNYYENRFGYDNTVSYDELLLPEVFEEPLFGNELFYHHKLDTVYYYRYDNGNWNLGGNSLYYYSPRDITSVDEEFISAFWIYPNPAKEKIYIKSGKWSPSKMELFDMHGQRVRSWRQGEKEYSLKFLKSGIYLLRITSGKRQGIWRIIKH